MMRFLTLLMCLVFPALAQEMYQFSVDQDRLSGAPDFSAMNSPLGPEDRLFVRNGHFYRVGLDRRAFTSDDERVRLYGVNLAFAGNFPEEKDAVRIAKRLRKLGVNLVRLHHMDSSPDEELANARSILTTGPYPTLNPLTVKRLRAFLDALAAEGLYVNLNLHVGYQFRPFVDGVPSMPNGAEIPRQSKPLHIFHPRMVELQVEFTHAVMQALKLKGDPVLGMVEIDNESSLLFSWQARGWQQNIAGAYALELERQWNAWLRAKYRSAGRLCEAWEGCPAGESLDGAGMSMVSIGEQDNEKRVSDYLLFLEETDRRYLLRMLDAVREESDELVPVAGTQLNFGGPMNFDSHAPLDYQDSHFYIDHYNFPNRSWDSHDWRIRDSSSVGTGLSTFLRLAFYREAGRPYTVSEYNQPYPNRYGTEIDVTLAAFGAMQDWDSIMHFAYSHNRSWERPAPSSFDLNGDWAKYPGSAQAAWLFRSGAIRPADAVLEIPLSKTAKLRATRNKRRNDFPAFLQEEQGVAPEVALRHRVAVIHDNSAETPAMAKTAGTDPYESDTGQLVYSPELKRYLIQAERAAGVIGFVGKGEKVTAGDLAVELAESARGFAAILITPLDDKPVAESGHLLLSNPGYVLGTQPGSDPVRPKRMVTYEGEPGWWTLEKDPAYGDRPSGSRKAVDPIWMERIESFVTLRSRARSITVYPLDGAGWRLSELGGEAVRKVGGGFALHLQAHGQEFSPWYEIVAER